MVDEQNQHPDAIKAGPNQVDKKAKMVKVERLHVESPSFFS
jgi:hypothetical protein